MLLADAHSLPFKDSAIDCLLNLAVMEHVEHPYIAGKEFYRILKKGGRMLGVVAFPSTTAYVIMVSFYAFWCL